MLVFFAIIAILVYRDRKNIEFKYGLITRRTKKGKKLIYQFAEKHGRKLQLLGNVGIIVGIGVLIYGFSIGKKISILYCDDKASHICIDFKTY